MNITKILGYSTYGIKRSHCCGAAAAPAGILLINSQKNCVTTIRNYVSAIFRIENQVVRHCKCSKKTSVILKPQAREKNIGKV